MSDTDIRERITAFLTAIGIDVRVEPLAGPSFLPGIRVDSGRLIVDPDRLAWPGDLLHEAGHLAVTPAALRPSVGGDLGEAPASPHAGEAEATAWAYAAVVATGLPPEVLFHAGGYHGRSQGLIQTFALGVYPGLAGLCAAGMAASAEEVRSKGWPPYPGMMRWLRA